MNDELERLAEDLAYSFGESLEFITVAESWPEGIPELPDEEQQELELQVYNRAFDILKEKFGR